MFSDKNFKKSNRATNIDAKSATVNTFFEQWIKEVQVKKYDGDLQIVSSSTEDIYRYSEAMLKHKPKDVLETL